MYNYPQIYNALRGRVSGEILRFQVERDLHFDAASKLVQAELRPQIKRDCSRLEAETLLVIAQQRVADEVDLRAAARRDFEIAVTRFEQRHLFAESGSSLAIALRKAQTKLFAAKQALSVSRITQQLLAFVIHRALS